MSKVAVFLFIALGFVEGKAITLRGTELSDSEHQLEMKTSPGDKPEFGVEQHVIDSKHFDAPLDVDHRFNAKDLEGKEDEQFLRELKMAKNNILDAAPWLSPRGQLRDAIKISFEDIELKENSCQNTDQPECFYDLRGRPGVWLCQKTFDVLTGEEQFRSICVNAKWKLPEPNHSCGCCGGKCPENCKCGCGFGQPDGTYLGRYVVNKRGREACVRKQLAIWAASNSTGDWSCKEDC